MQDCTASMCSYKYILQVTNSEELSMGLLSLSGTQTLVREPQSPSGCLPERAALPKQPWSREGWCPPGCWWVQTPAWPKESCCLWYNRVVEHLQQQLKTVRSHATSLNHGALSLPLLPKSSFSLPPPRRLEGVPVDS